MARDKSAHGTSDVKTSGSRRIGSGSPGPGSGPAGSRPSRTRTASTASRPGRLSKESRAQRRAARSQRFTQIKTAFRLTRQADPRLVPLLAIAFLVPFVLMVLLGIAIGHPFLLGLVGLMLGVLATTVVFGRRVQSSAFSQVEGQVGAAAAVLQNMRGDWRVTPAVGFTREQDLVHRVLGKPGIVLVAEGAASRTRGLIVAERKRLSRFIGDVPVYDVTVGDGEGQVPLRGLDRYFAKLPQNVKPKDVNVLDRKLKAMPTGLPVPKGPLPSGGRMPRGKVR